MQAISFEARCPQLSVGGVCHFILLGLLVDIVGFVTSKAPEPSLADVFSSLGCERACWLRIEPGVTSISEVNKILASHDIVCRVKSFGGGLGNTESADLYTWLPTNDNLIDNAHRTFEVTLFFRNGKVVKRNYSAPI